MWPCVHVRFRKAKRTLDHSCGLWGSEQHLGRALSLAGCRTAFRSDCSSGGFQDLTPDFTENFYIIVVLVQKGFWYADVCL